MEVQDLDPIGESFGLTCEARAVGWLGPPPVPSGGRLSREAFDVLMEHCLNPWQPFVLAGRHRCERCVYSGGPGAVHASGRTVRIDGRNLFVPTKDVLYVAPIMIVHYVDAHGYVPPAPFVDALLACPPMRSMAYLKMLHDLGVRAPRPPSGA